MPVDALGSIISQGDLLRIENAFVDEVFFSNRNTGYLIISYSVLRQSGLTAIEQLRLNVTNNTVLLNSFRLPICLCDIREGMWVDVIFSSRMTRSIPPQANAYQVIVRSAAGGRPPVPPGPPPGPRPPAGPRPPQGPRPPFQPPANMTTGRVIWANANNNLLLTVMPNNLNQQMLYGITDTTIILNRNGFPIGLSDLRPGQLVTVTHANFQTPGIPPRTTAFRIQVI